MCRSGTIDINFFIFHFCLFHTDSHMCIPLATSFEHKSWADKALDTHRTIVSNGWGKAEIEKEVQRLNSLRDNKKITESKRKDVDMRYDSLLYALCGS